MCWIGDLSPRHLAAVPEQQVRLAVETLCSGGAVALGPPEWAAQEVEGSGPHSDDLRRVGGEALLASKLAFARWCETAPADVVSLARRLWPSWSVDPRPARCAALALVSAGPAAVEVALALHADGWSAPLRDLVTLSVALADEG